MKKIEKLSDFYWKAVISLQEAYKIRNPNYEKEKEEREKELEENSVPEYELRHLQLAERNPFCEQSYNCLAIIAPKDPSEHTHIPTFKNPEPNIHGCLVEPPPKELLDSLSDNDLNRWFWTALDPSPFINPQSIAGVRKDYGIDILLVAYKMVYDDNEEYLDLYYQPIINPWGVFLRNVKMLLQNFKDTH